MNRALWIGFGIAIVAGLVCWAVGAGIAALWAFVAASVLIAFAAPMPIALVSPVYMGIFGWLVDMLPFLILTGWAAVSLRWVLSLVRDRRWPLGGRWVWLVVGLALWTTVGIAVNLLSVGFGDWKHFMLLLSLQVLASAVLLAVVDSLGEARARTQAVAALVLYMVVLTGAVFLQHAGVDLQAVQDTEVGDRLEQAYGVDAFENSVGMIKWARADDAGVGKWRQEMKAIEERVDGLPPFEVFLPKFKAFDPYVVIRFKGSARPFEDELARADVSLPYDSVGFAPANLVPRWRSFPRNALTYAGISAVILPFALYLAWTQRGRLQMLGRTGVVCCLLGAGFALARGAWIAVALVLIYLAIDRGLARGLKLQAAVAFGVVIVIFTAIFLVLYADDPLTARAGDDSSVATRQELLGDTVEDVNGIYFLIGFGSERSRTEDGDTRSRGAYGKYIPPAGTHSTYLNYLYRTGLVGALGILAIYGASFLHARRAAKERSGEERIYRIMAAAAVLAAGAHAVILSLYVEPAYTLVISLILGLAMAGALQLSRSVLPWKAGT
jgi:O-Antigen ligase